MQVIRINTWMSATDALAIIELLDALRESLVQQHSEGINEIMLEDNRSATVAIDERQLELPIDFLPPVGDDIPF